MVHVSRQGGPFLSPIFALVGAIFLYRQRCLARPHHRIPVPVYAAIIVIFVSEPNANERR
jgi:hypothetical protein